MAKRDRGREALGIYVEGEEIRVARVRATKDGFEVLGLAAGRLCDRIDQVGLPAESPEKDAEFGGEDLEPNVDVGREMESGNAGAIWELIEQVGGKPGRIGANLLDAEATFHLLPQGPRRQVRKALKRILAEWGEGAGAAGGRDAEVIAEHAEDVLAATYATKPALVDLIMAAQDMMPGKRARILRVDLPETALAAAAGAQGDLGEEELTAVLHVGLMVSRVILLRGRRLFRVLPLMSDDGRTIGRKERILRRLMYQRDAGQLKNLDRLYLAGQVDEDLLRAIQAEFDDVQVELLMPDCRPGESLDPEAWEGIHAWILPISLALGTFRRKSRLPRYPNFLPQYVRDRQEVLALRWYHVGIFALMFLVTSGLVYQGKEWTRLNEQLEQRRAVLNESREEWKEIVAELERRSKRNKDFEAYLARMQDLSIDLIEWTKLLEDLSRFTQETNSIWIRELTCREDGFILKGFSLFRNRIARLAANYSDIQVEKVVRTIRSEKTVYDFELKVGLKSRDKTAKERRAEIRREKRLRERERRSKR
jgi:Tfp pilus assembly protein PilN